MRKTTIEASDYSARETRTSLQAAIGVLIWALSITVSCVALVYLPVPKFGFGIMALLLNLGVGLAVIAIYIRWLKALDEMLRKIWIESMAMTFGALWIAFGSLMILEAAEINYIGSLEIGLLTMLAGLGMALGAIRTLKY